MFFTFRSRGSRHLFAAAALAAPAASAWVLAAWIFTTADALAARPASKTTASSDDDDVIVTPARKPKPKPKPKTKSSSASQAKTAGTATPKPSATAGSSDTFVSPPPTTKATASAESAGAKSGPGKGQVLWDYWYTVKINNVVHYEYYNDHAELNQGRVVFQNHAWKQEEDFINEEELGVFSNNDPEVTPLFFNFHSTYRTIETSIDGNVKADKVLVVRVRKASTELPLIKRMVPSKTFFSELFPVWLGHRLSGFRTGQMYPFETILEDNIEAEFSTVHGEVRPEPADDFATKSHTTKLTVNYRDLKSLWWVEKSGAPVRIEMPTQKTVVERVPKKTAENFLDSSE